MPDTPYAELMKHKLGIYRSARYSKTPIGTITVGGWLSWSRQGTYGLDWIDVAQGDWQWDRTRQEFGRAAATVDRIRDTNDPAERRALKETLPAVTWGSGRVTGETGVVIPRDRRNARDVNPLICFDIDGVDDAAGERGPAAPRGDLRLRVGSVGQRHRRLARLRGAPGDSRCGGLREGLVGSRRHPALAARSGHRRRGWRRPGAVQLCQPAVLFAGPQPADGLQRRALPDGGDGATRRVRQPPGSGS